MSTFEASPALEASPPPYSEHDDIELGINSNKTPFSSPHATVAQQGTQTAAKSLQARRGTVPLELRLQNNDEFATSPLRTEVDSRKRKPPTRLQRLRRTLIYWLRLLITGIVYGIILIIILSVLAGLGYGIYQAYKDIWHDGVSFKAVMTSLILGVVVLILAFLLFGLMWSCFKREGRR